MKRIQPYLHVDFGYLPPEEEKLLTALQNRGREALAQNDRLHGDTFLNAIEAPAEVEICSHCGSLYHANFTGCYFDPNDCGDLVELFGEEVKLLEPNSHYCDYGCVWAAVEYAKKTGKGENPDEHPRQTN